MQLRGKEWQFSSQDLGGYLNCRHLTALELRIARGTLARPKPWDPSLEALWERGARHERDFVEYLAAQGHAITVIPGVDIDISAVDATRAAMETGAPAIVQAALQADAWVGRADVLLRVERPSALGTWSYEPWDTKLSRDTKAATIQQLCLYAELLGAMQGVVPETVHVVTPWSDLVPQSFRVADYSAYYRRVRSGLLGAVAADPPAETYPHPVPHCEICAWRNDCDAKRHQDDHLSLVAGISSIQIVELNANGISTLAGLAAMPLPMQWRPERGSRLGFERVREQARIQLETRKARALRFETLPIEAGFGLAALPDPSPADIYLDFEGDRFVGERGQEYLLGYAFSEGANALTYRALWGLTRKAEKQAFEAFIDFVIERWQANPNLHIYHFGGYESGALKRLMGRYATREEELDRILRGRLLVDLLGVTRHAIRAGVESYSIKRLEPLFGFVRATDLPDANIALTRLHTRLELGDADGIKPEEIQVVTSYNRDDCLSTHALHLWLEQLRGQAVASGTKVDRPAPGDGRPNENVTEWLARIMPLVEALTKGVPDDALERTTEQHGRWLLAQLLDFHRREAKASWWEYFRLADLDAEELIEEKAGLSSLAFEATVGGTEKCPVHRYRFPPQETDLRPGKKLRAVGGKNIGSVEAIDAVERTVDIKKAQVAADFHPHGVFVHEHVGADPMMEALVRIAEYVQERGLEGAGPYQAARDLLLRVPPRWANGGPVRYEGEETLAAALRIAGMLEAGVLPIQGPPGAGKTYTGSRMISELVRQGRRVGIVANSHAVIRNLIDAVIERADEQGLNLTCVQKAAEKEADCHRLRFLSKNGDLITALHGAAQVGGGTAWLWSSPEAFDSADVLFVDEAAQMSLANVLAVSQAARTVVLLGDPRQLDQPMQGTHPEGTDTSALDHVLAGAQTIGPEQGLFLEETWRLHPDICAFTSELFYEGKLHARPGLEQQVVQGAVHGSGLRYLPVPHASNHNCSPEEAEVVASLVHAIIEGGTNWTDKDTKQHPVGLEDILIITPYNAQVYELSSRLPGARIGTVDKFQGQEAPIAIYSLASSSHVDAPRGMEFLYSLNRLNVATSRARCLSFLVCSPILLEAECRNPRQMQLANSFCRFVEMAR
ncbi:TM0106 family RecB-like putative nuclease [Aminobacter aminovorans]|uniref:Nuclease n=1 Tax=Aminobacter aminovorans TaxID=83263 RepID=A0AAC8YLK6_AMIAI|nr:TM0106 family RecB-like putative nuclease [Aminobacter aminovorans]AMS40144.1 nuclease [Aminobacter aminovorans]MBB3709871.1 uncharacterized protein [Aminobacter aminovorans]